MIRHLFNFKHEDVTAEHRKPSRIFEVSKKLCDYIDEKRPSMLHQFPALPIFLYSQAYQKLPREVAKLFVSTKHNKTTVWQLLSMHDDFGRVKMSDTYETYPDIKVIA